MSLVRQRPRLLLQSHGPIKREILEHSEKEIGGYLSPDIKLTSPSFPTKTEKYNVCKIGRYVLDNVEGDTYKAIDWQTREEKICKVCMLSGFLCLDYYVVVICRISIKNLTWFLKTQEQTHISVKEI